MYYAKQVSQQTKNIQKQKFIMAFVKQLRYANHKKSFNNIKYQTNTELSNKYWNIMSANKTTNVSWEILGTYK